MSLSNIEILDDGISLGNNEGISESIVYYLLNSMDNTKDSMPDRSFDRYIIIEFGVLFYRIA